MLALPAPENQTPGAIRSLPREGLPQMELAAGVVAGVAADLGWAGGSVGAL